MQADTSDLPVIKLPYAVARILWSLLYVCGRSKASGEMLEVLNAALLLADVDPKAFSIALQGAICKAVELGLEGSFAAAKEGVDTFDLGQGLVLNRLAKTVESSDGRRLLLAPIQYGVLDLLVQRRGQCLSRAQLFDIVWGDSPSDYKTVDAAIHYLRSALNEFIGLACDNKKGEHWLIKTRRGQGYLIYNLPPR